jgi:hypothetical protein
MLILRPSKIKSAGVGVFTTVSIKRGGRIILFSKKENIKFIKTNKPNFFTKRFCPYDKAKKGYWCPEDFCRMSIGWYINHSKNSNVSPIKWVALRYIKKGEELTTNYKDL